MQILAATTNTHKLKEFRSILEAHGITCMSPGGIGGIPEVPEDGDTFEANALAKATVVARETGHPVFADDSGLEVFALDGEPGVRSARYAGSNATDAERINKLLRRLRDDDDRSARFVCVIAVASPSGPVGTKAGEIRGTIAHVARGLNGFGYDPVFIPTGYMQTFGELPAEVKNGLSHRATALKNAVAAGLFQRLCG